VRATDYTPAQYLAAISEALRADDMEAVVGLMHGLAVVDPASARSILDVIELLRALDAEATP